MNRVRLRTEIKIESKDAVGFAAAGERATATLEETIVVATGGTPPYSISSDPGLPITQSETPNFSILPTYTVVDTIEDSASSYATLTIT